MEENVRRFPTPPPEVARLQEFLPGSRTEMFKKVILAVGCASGDAEDHGDADYCRRLDEEVFPFLEAEREKAAAEEGLTPILRWEEAIMRGEA